MIASNLNASHSAHGNLEDKSIDVVEWVYRLRFFCGEIFDTGTHVIEQLRKTSSQNWAFQHSSQTLGKVVAEAIGLALRLRKRVVVLFVDCWTSAKQSTVSFSETQMLRVEEEASRLVA